MSNTQLYFVGCICTTLIEHTTACSFLDEEHEHPDHFSGNDSNRYTFGKIAGHNVVIVAPSRGNGHIVIETMTKDLFDTFANIRICLLVGLGGGAPTTKHETRLGDVVVGSPTDGTGAIYQYDNDKTIQKKCFVHISSLDRPWDVVLAAMPSFSSKYMLQAHQIQKSIKAVLAREAKPHKINSHQSQESDQLYQSITTVPHRGSWKRLCESQDMLLRRQGHNHRDDKATILYSETRASGLPYRVPCLVYLEQVPGYSPINRLSVPGSIAKSCSGLEMRVQIKEVADGRVLDRVGEVQLSRYLVKICLVSKSLDGPDRNQMNRQCALLETSANSGFHNKDFGIPLQAASSRGHMSLVRTLLERGADVNLNGGKYGNALYAAPERGYGRIMRLLLGLGVEVNVQGGVYSTALQVAVHEGHDKFLQALLQNGASVNAQKGGHDALLHLASEKGHEKVVRILLDLGADLPMTDRSGPMPLHAALRKGMVQTGELLLAQRRIRSLLQCSNGNGDRTPLNHTSKNGHMEVLKLPIHSITAIKAMDSRVRTTSHVAVINGHPKIPRLEVDGGAQIEPQGTECGYLPSAAQPHASFTARLKIYITKACNLLGAFQKPLSNGYTRIIWKNKSNQRYISDIRQLKPGGIARLFEKLEQFEGAKIISMSNCSDADQWRTTWNSLSTALSAKAEQWTRMVSNKTQQESKSGLPTHTGHTPVSPQTQTQPYPIHIQKKDLLMICMQSGKRSKQLDQKYLHEHGVDSDRALFSLLRKATSYRRNRLRSLFTLRTIRELKLVMFKLPMDNCPFIPYRSCPTHHPCKCLPPDDMIMPQANAEYRCTSPVRDTCPPVPAEVLMRYFDNPLSIDSTQTWLLELLPKRICGELEGKPTGPAQGWGISFEEGWDGDKIGLILFMIFFLGSFLFAVMWTVFKGDISGAFGVAAWWVSAATLLLGYIATRPDDR